MLALLWYMWCCKIHSRFRSSLRPQRARQNSPQPLEACFTEGTQVWPTSVMHHILLYITRRPILEEERLALVPSRRLWPGRCDLSAITAMTTTLNIALLQCHTLVLSKNSIH
ncbi:hypothetical protein BDV98DRAFT_563567 [Pterulicium gracile]|uniref:Uncharacterized protein n=1 Tax=Pterulicium gracile TaxID=1884261 RepID=A0A5C3QQ47_9AGAR|nr:hypothetical protein BDV98DRAFT_563567 [Pterula gracilis]